MTHSDLIGKLGQVSRPTVWYGLLAAPLVWFMQLNLGLAFTPLACGGNPWPLYLLNAAAVLVSLSSLGVSLRLKNLQGQPGGVVEHVTHFLGRFGAWHAGVFVLLTLMTAVVGFFIPACRLR
ncbi:hypothetical protein [Deinococcus humi]|uniref:Uncharacterized protein n=1 Tax=Deinococcus humi TaxID=662880 RepID=A0A7W8JUH6_9DEIO|nr:hypothetical protein [Deinococcus humi]MBB5363440.1 hypothetical protein [Deinococcus humi]GGO26504.1 hypothetical protein GCM10008949_17330 [Deinococcus humi]